MSDSPIPDVLLTRLQVHSDDRGLLVEVFRASANKSDFLQSNHSRSKKGVLRGLHYHRKQADLWYVVSGRAQVVLVDLREKRQPPESQMLILDGKIPTTLWIPAGVAHGFLALSDVDLIYLVTREYDSNDEYGIAWDDPALGVSWDTDEPLLSPRDQHNQGLRWEKIRPFS